MKGKIKKLRGILVLLLLMLLSANSKYIMSMAVESEISVNTENITPTANVVLEKYINYEKDGKKSLLVQYQVSAGTEYKNNETFVPLAATGILINAPKIENSFPESVEVISRSTLLTNGSSDGKDYKTTYKQENGELQIAAFNKKDENGNYYETYKKDAKDIYTVILNYGENAYNGENIEKELELNGKVVEVLKVKDSPKVEERYENKTTVKENISKLISTKVDSTKIYNGYIKSNAVNGTDYETNYKENVEINVSKKDLGTSKIDLTQKFINKNNEAVETENIIFKSSTLDKQKVLDILGENGYLKILDKDGNTLGELNKDTEVKEDGKYVVNYPENTTKVTLEISNAEKAGYITIQNQKQIKPEEKNTELKQIQEVYNADEVTSLEIKDSQTRVSIVPNLKTWTNEKQNNVEFEVDLYNNSASCNLFKNPVIEIQLPEETRKVILADATIMHANGLTVKSTKYDEKTRIIRVELEGTQNKYLSEKIEKGTILTIPATIMLEKDIEDKDIDLKVGFKNDNIYTGKTETGTFTTKVALENFNQATVSDEIAPTLTKSLRILSGAKNAEPSENTSVPTASGITLNVTPVIGDVTRDTVYEGEFIKYEITATNTTGKDIDNVKINAVLPEGVIYTNLKTEEVKTRLVNSYEYDENNKNVEIQLGKIKANKSASTFIEVKVKDLEENTNSKEIATKISSYIGDAKTDEKEIKHTVKKAEYKVFLMSNEYAYNQIQHELTVMGNPDKEVTVTFKIPDYSEMEYINFGYQYSFDENGNKYINQEDNKARSKTIIDENTFSYTVKPGCYLLYSPINTSKIDRKPNESVAELKLYATVNDKYKSNESRVKLPYESLKISISSDKEGEKVNYDEEINYEIKVTNIGRGNYKENGIYYSLVWIKDILPEEVKPIGIIYNKFDTKLDEETKEEIGFEEEKNILENISTRKKDLNGNRLPDIDLPLLIPWKETVTIQVKVKAGFVYKETEIQNRASVTGFSYALQEKDGQTRPHDTVILPMQSDILTNTILPPESIRSNLRAISQNPQTQAEQNSDNGTNNGNNATNQTEENENEEQKYSVKGYAWNDKNSDGIKQSSEEIISGIPTYLMDSKGNVVKEAATNEKGIYSFSDVKKGEYTVVFKYDTNKYTLTKCKVNGASENANSNATKQNVVIYGENIVAGVTDEINVNKDVLYINLGLIENKKFDFKVDNYISKITVKTKNGTKETPYNNTTLAKSEIKAKEIEGSNVTIEYKVIITNNGEVAGKVGKVIDYLPEGLNVASESLTTWFKNTDGGYINTTLENTLIEPGKSVELTLLTTRDLTENSTGTLTNKVKIDGITNELNLDETNMQNNTAKSEVILSISTGLLIVISIAIIIAVIVLMILNTKFKIFKKLPIRFLAILFVLSTTILMQGQNDSRAVRTEYPVGRIESEQKQLYLVGSDYRWRNSREDRKTIYMYDENGGYVPCTVNIGSYYLINYDGKLYETDSFSLPGSKRRFEEMTTEVASNFEAIESDAWQEFFGPDISYKYLQINSSRSIECYYLKDDWIQFMELQDGEELTTNSDGTYSVGSYTHNFGYCISPFMPGGDSYINIENLAWNAQGITVEGDKYINANAMYPITYYRVYNPNPAISYVETEGAPRQVYSYDGVIYYNQDVDMEPEPAPVGNIPKEYLEDPNVKFGRYEDPGIVLEGNTDENIKIGKRGDEYLLGPFDISRYRVENYENRYHMYDESEKIFQGYEIEILGNETEPGSGEYWYYNFNPYGKGNKNSNGKFETDYHICDHNGNPIDLNATGTFYIKLSKDEIDGLEVVTQVRARTEVFFTKDVEEDRVGTDVWYAGDGYQKVKQTNGEITTMTTLPIHIESEGEQYIYWTHFQGSVQVHKTDEIGTDEKGNPISMEGISFLINRCGSGWAYYDTDEYGWEYINFGDLGSGKKPVVLKTDSNGDTQIVHGLEPSYYTDDATQNEYMIYEVMEDRVEGDGGDYSLPDYFYSEDFKFDDYYKPTYNEGQAWWCPYKLKSLGVGDLYNYDGSEKSLKDDFYYQTASFNGNWYWQGDNWYDPALCHVYESRFHVRNVTNIQDYISLRLTKTEEFKDEKDLSGFKFKIAKCEYNIYGELIGYKWVRKLNEHDEHSNVEYISMDRVNDATTLVTDSEGKTPILRRLMRSERVTKDGDYTHIYDRIIPCRYVALEVEIPERLKEEYTTYKNDGKFFYGAYDNGSYLTVTDDMKNLEGKITFNNPTREYGIITPSLTKRVTDNTRTNFLDYVSLQAEKKNEKGELLDDITFGIMDVTNPNDPFWVKVDNNDFISDRDEDKIRVTNQSELPAKCKFVSGEYGEQGYTRIIKGVPLNRKYKIYEIDVGKYREVYKLKEFTFRGATWYGNVIEEIDTTRNIRKPETNIYRQADGINRWQRVENDALHKYLEQNRQIKKDKNGKDIYNVVVVKETNKQFYGSFQFHKQDMLTDTGLKDIGIKIKREVKTSDGKEDMNRGYIKATLKEDGRYEVTSIDASYSDGTTFYTDANGNLKTVYMVPLFEEDRKTRIKYYAYETEIGKNSNGYEYFAMKADYLKDAIERIGKDGPFRDNTALNEVLNVLRIKKGSPVDVQDVLKILDDASAWDDENFYFDGEILGPNIDQDSYSGSFTAWLKMYLELNYQEYDLIKNLGEINIEKDTQEPDNTKTVITPNTKENRQTFIDISGSIWEDVVGGKTINTRDGIKKIGNPDKNIDNIEVRLMKKIDCTKLKRGLTAFKNYPDTLNVEIQKVKTGSIEGKHGYYKFTRVKLEDLANYYIEFTYDGMTYQSVTTAYNSYEDKEIKNSDGDKVTVKIPKQDTSKAEENLSLRNELNDAFGEITGLEQTVRYRGKDRLVEYNEETSEVENTRVKEVSLVKTYPTYWDRPEDAVPPNTRLIDDTQDYDYILDASISSNILTGYYNMMAYGDKNGKNPSKDKKNSYYSNGRELLKEIPNLNLGLYVREQPDLTLTKNLYRADVSVNGKKYTYMYGSKNTPPTAGKVDLGVQFDYKLPLYEADVHTDTNSDVSDKMKTTVMYKVQLSNLSTNLYTKIYGLNDFYTKVKIGSKDSGLTLKSIYRSDRPNETEFKEQVKYKILDTKPKQYTGSEITSNFEGSKIRFDEPIKLGSQKSNKNTTYLYLEFEITNLKEYYVSTVNKKSLAEMASKLQNYVEIDSYSVYKDANYSVKHAQVDCTSIPNNFRIDNYTDTHEDDDSRAPGLVLIKPEARNITGMVFEDSPVTVFYNGAKRKINTVNPEEAKIDAKEERIGNGIYDGNRTYEHMKDSNDNFYLDKGISGVKIRLRELCDDGTYKNAKMWVPKDDNSGEGSWEDAIISSDKDGNFTIPNYIPGNYKVEFVWGEDAGGKDATRFKGTVFIDSTNVVENEDKYDSKIVYNNKDKWYKDDGYNSDNASVATDDYIRRLAIDKEALGVTEEAYEGQEELWKRVTDCIDKAKNADDTYDSLKYMHSSTADFRVEVERDTDSGSETNQVKNEESMNNVPNNGFEFNINNIDFGIIERARQSMGVQKHIKSIKITTAEGRPVVIASIDINGKINVIAGERYISGGYDLEYFWIQMDKQIQESMKVEIEYEITVGSRSELDYDNPEYYLYGTNTDNPILLRATYLFDYLGGAQITSDGEEKNPWITEIIKEGEKYLKIVKADSKSTVPTLTDMAIQDIYENAGSDLNEANQYIENNYYTDNNLEEKGFRKDEAIERLKKIYKQWIDNEYKTYDGNINTLRDIKLHNKEIIQGHPEDNILVNESYKSGEIRTEKLKASKLISVGEGLSLTNDVELATVAVDKTQKTGASVDFKNSPLYDIAEYATLSPAQGENRDYFGMTMVAISILTLLGSGIILIKRFIKNR